jgi:hypothetical protein
LGFKNCLPFDAYHLIFFHAKEEQLFFGLAQIPSDVITEKFLLE